MKIPNKFYLAKQISEGIVSLSIKEGKKEKDILVTTLSRNIPENKRFDPDFYSSSSHYDTSKISFFELNSNKWQEINISNIIEYKGLCNEAEIHEREGSGNQEEEA